MPRRIAAALATGPLSDDAEQVLRAGSAAATQTLAQPGDERLGDLLPPFGVLIALDMGVGLRTDAADQRRTH